MTLAVDRERRTRGGGASALTDASPALAASARAWALPLTGVVVATGLAVLVVSSLFVGVADVTPAALVDSETRAETLAMLTVSRVPRTVALVLAGASLAVAGLIMQLLTRNPFVEPSTTGTMEFAGAGLLVSALLIPDASISLRMVIGAGFAVAGTALFMRILGAIPVRDVLVVPLIGLMLGGIVSAAASFVAYRYDLVQSMSAWTTGDFSAVVQGRYEMLWITGILTVAALVAADRFTVAGMGEEVATNLGLNHRTTMALGVTLVAVIAAAVVVTVGMLPFIGLVVPNLVAAVMGANARRSLPWVAAGGAGLVLVCDLAARTVRAPYELPIATVLGMVGAAVFLTIVLRRSSRVG